MCCSVCFAFELQQANDLESYEYSMNTHFSPHLLNRFDEETINAFGIPTEYILTLASEGRLIVADTMRWKYLTRQFDKGYEFIPILRKMLFDSDVPQEFLFLAMAESEFQSHALSSKKAAGIWQLMPATAKELGLLINEYIDERQDPIKSTQAAIKYLQYLYNATGKWYLAAMAYNCGLGRLNRAIAQAGDDSIEILLNEDEQYLPLETRNYLRKIMSMSLAFSNAHQLKRDDKEYMLNRGAADSLVIVNVKAGNSLANIAKGANMTLESLKNYNRHFKYDFIPLEHKEYQVYIPYEKLSYFRQNFKNSLDITSYFLPYKVKKGDTLFAIARKNGLTVAKIKEINSLKSDFLSVNQKLLLPIRPTVVSINNKKKTIKKTSS
ncbi:LysM peptidoglycan-binding domain-containing protein [Helicobacter aurati]|uniref:LysM peptidoglycan-binding domain-containing protein n=2 Tax=Helicobacter aurati TaxID=137778 RepID=A0A3D8J7L4_9HELI|nr:LysM peptidoglycan-binding domain-containing protein [Helicobacter aurati]